MFPALQGDCFFISFNDEKKTHILIDGGFEETYHQFLKIRLIEIAEKGEEIALLVVTHIDADHIEGIIELFKENKTSLKSALYSNAYQIKNFIKNFSTAQEVESLAVSTKTQLFSKRYYNCKLFLSSVLWQQLLLIRQGAELLAIHD